MSCPLLRAVATTILLLSVGPLCLAAARAASSAPSDADELARSLAGAYVGVTAAGAAAGSADADCHPVLVPGVGGNSPTFIVAHAGVLVMVEPAHHLVRRIYIDAHHRDAAQPTVAGDSIGWWEGSTLVVETVGLPSGETVVERIRKLPGTDRLESIVNGRAQLAERRDDLRWAEIDCGNAAAIAGTGDAPGAAAGGRSSTARHEASRAPERARPALTGAWQIESPVITLLTRHGERPPLSAAAEKLYRQRQLLLRSGKASAYDTSLQCAPLGVPRSDFEGLPIDIVQGTDAVFIGSAWNYGARIAYFGAPRPSPTVPGDAGHWTAHWDGDVLVLDGNGFSARTLLDAAGMPHSRALHVVQRLKLLDNGARLELRTAIADPQTFRQAWQTVHTYRRLAGGRLPVSECRDAAPVKLPWSTDSPPPALNGVHLGDTREQVIALLGAPGITRRSGNTEALVYDDRAMVLVLDQHHQVATLIAAGAPAGDIGGVRVGDVRASVLALWGEPHVVQGDEALYLVGDWGVTIQLGPQQQVSRISVARIYGNTNLE